MAKIASGASLSDDLARTFVGGRYKSFVLQEDIVVYRVGSKDQALGQFFSKEIPVSEVQVRIDKAIRPEWPGGAKSQIDMVYKVRIPKGTTVHVGEIANQGDFYLGGTQQIVVEKPWEIPGVEVIDSWPIVK